MKKIAIMTYHDMVNYGSFFQMFALQRIIENMGCYVEVINYKPNSNFTKKIVNNNKMLKKIWLLARNNKIWIKFNDCYNKYIKKTKVVSTKNDFKKLNKRFNIFIAGSDQIWSPNHFDIHYFLDFVNDNLTRISYAPSVVIDSFDMEQKKQIKRELTKFKFLSVREKKSKEIIEKNFKIETRVVLDPTLVVDSSFYKELLHLGAKEYNNDVLCYFLGNNNYDSKVEKIMKILKYEKCINLSFETEIDNAENYKEASPVEFLNYINNSKLVLTDSFHGVALSIKFHKQFIYFDRFSQDDPICQNSRIYNLLELLSIDNTNYNDFLNNTYKEIDYSIVDSRLLEEINKSKKFLSNAILEETSER